MGSHGDESDVFDGVPLLAPSLARDGLGYHSHHNTYQGGAGASR